MRVERRDHRSRAATLHRVVSWIIGNASPAREAPRSVVRPDAGRRILKQLAVRGLVRRTRGGWIPHRLLTMPTDLQQVELDELTDSSFVDRRDLAQLQCPKCRTKGFVRYQNIVQELEAERQFDCWVCDYSWTVSDRRYLSGE